MATPGSVGKRDTGTREKIMTATLDIMVEEGYAAATSRRIERIALLHRTGRVALTDPSVVIAVSTPHRAEAFDACRFLIDSLKRDVPIWKREVWDDGTRSWVDPPPQTPKS